MNNSAKSYSNKLIRTGVGGFFLGVWIVYKFRDMINPLWIIPFGAVSIAALYFGISLRKKLLLKMESETRDTPKFPGQSSQYYWVMYILTGLILLGFVLLRNYHVGLPFFLGGWIVAYSVWLYYQVKRINEFLNY